ncbi:unnamed protein product [Heligmosomoides polygyrus]|uniref:Uncharacterized protein n=1 Tax=Heligmosomoides polygyrus TaxID=6339 RepID=A0A183G822_HELPZ|nr:unnamed protein product [Heligmosomoides polygyrus]
METTETLLNDAAEDLTPSRDTFIAFSIISAYAKFQKLKIRAHSYFSAFLFLHVHVRLSFIKIVFVTPPTNRGKRNGGRHLAWHGTSTVFLELQGLRSHPSGV